jgi:VIT1/CCC1 family predicted Fe2+/Mn2+ transporter
MMTYEFGLQDPDNENPVVSGLFTFFSFVIFGAIPIGPYFFLPPDFQTFVLSLISTFGALIALGLLRWHATSERLVRSVGETVLVGATCAAVAYGVGFLVGA